MTWPRVLAGGVVVALLSFVRLVLERDLSHWGPRAAARIVRLAVKVLPERWRAIREEEWQRALADVGASPDGPTGLAFAVGVLVAAGCSRLRYGVAQFGRRLARNGPVAMEVARATWAPAALVTSLSNPPVSIVSLVWRTSMLMVAVTVASLLVGPRRWYIAYPAAVSLSVLAWGLSTGLGDPDMRLGYALITASLAGMVLSAGPAVRAFSGVTGPMWLHVCLVMWVGGAAHFAVPGTGLPTDLALVLSALAALTAGRLVVTARGVRARVAADFGVAYRAATYGIALIDAAWHPNLVVSFTGVALAAFAMGVTTEFYGVGVTRVPEGRPGT